LTPVISSIFLPTGVSDAGDGPESAEPMNIVSSAGNGASAISAVLPPDAASVDDVPLDAAEDAASDDVPWDWEQPQTTIASASKTDIIAHSLDFCILCSSF
jgi:hypothetical protein